jgi:predicted metal-dependent phosphoesterase TrpH
MPNDSRINSCRRLNVDLHCHSTASDGDLSPTAVVERAVAHGVDILAITDHDNIDGFNEAKHAAGKRIKLVSGIEFSAVWKGIGIHIVGLDFKPALLENSIRRQKQARTKRTLKIAQRLEKKGVINPLDGAKRFATSDIIGRPHFAKYLVSQGLFESEAEAFKQWMGNKKVGDIKTTWPPIEAIVADITTAGGYAVLAHPQYYAMTNRKLGKLLGEFKECGGIGLEVCASGLKPEQTAYFASLCNKYDFMASRGSDFHSPTNQWIELGRVAALPDTVTPIWQLFK